MEGDRLLGRFTVGERIGRGGHGTVHRAWDERLCREVAVKAVEGAPADRVLREAHAAARLNHPGIVTLYELGEENGVAYLVSELVKGPNLRECAASGRLSDRDLAEIGAEACGALSHAHAQGVVHRDVKPDNILVRARPGRRMRAAGERATIADFGIATVTDEPALTATGQVVGTLAYMAPEQAAGEGAGPAADTYSLALTLYELWAGFNPLAGPTPAATARAIGSELGPLIDQRPELPPALCAAIDAALAPDPDDRPELEQLQNALDSAAGALHPDRPVPEPAEPPPSTPLPDAIPARPFAVLLTAGAIAAFGLLAGLPGLAIVLAALFAPAALLLSRPGEWLAPILAPVLGVIGLAPAFLVAAASHPRPSARVSLAVLGWAWTAVLGSITAHGLGVTPPADAAGWVGSGPVAVGTVLEPLASPDAIAIALVWAGAAVLLGALLDAAGPALLIVAGLVWAAGLVAALGAIGGPAAPSALLAPSLLAALGWLAWDRAGRPELGPWLPDRGASLLARLSPAAPSQPPPAPARPRHPADAPLADSRTRAARAASRHVSAALHGAGSRPG